MNVTFTVVPPTLIASILAATSIHLSWNSDSEVVTYEIMWETNDIGGCSGGSDVNNITITDSSNSYDIMGLEENSNYIITLRASNYAGGCAADSVTAFTSETGEINHIYYFMLCLSSTFSSICSSIFCECVQFYRHQHHCSVGGSGLYPPQRKHNRLLSTVWE